MGKKKHDRRKSGVDKNMTITDEEVDNLVKMIEKELGFKCFVVSGKETELSEKTRNESK